MEIEKDRKHWMLFASIIVLAIGLMWSIWCAGSLWYELKDMREKEQQRQEEITNAQGQNDYVPDVADTSR